MRIGMRIGLGALGAVAFVSFGRAASAQPTPPPPDLTAKTGRGPSDIFGGKGQLAISSDAALTIQSASATGAGNSTTTITLAPAADYFVIQNLSVGGFIGLDYTKTGDNSATAFSIGPRVGYNFPLSDFISVWPKAGFAYAHTSFSTPAGAATTVSTSGDNFRLNLFVPFMLHPAPHFFAGFGPFLDTDLSGDVKTTVFGARLTVGGWFDI